MNSVRLDSGFLPAARAGAMSLKLLLCLWSISPTLFLSACHSKPVITADQPIPVLVRTPNQVQQPVSVAVSGAVEANATAMTAFEVNGRVEKVYVEEGQHVVKGQVLAELDSTDYKHGYKAALGAADAAQADERKAKNGLRPEELAQARIAFERTQDEYLRMKFLFDRKSLDANDFHKFEAAWQAAKENYQMAQEGARAEDREAAEAQAYAAVAQMQDAKTRLAKCRLVAPISGFIGMKHINAGDFAAAGVPVFSVLDLEVIKVRVAVPESELGDVHVGSKATLTIPALAGHKFEGGVETLGVTADPLSRTYTAKIAVPNSRHLLRDAMVGEARIFGTEQVHVLTVPGDAVVRDGHGVANVYVYDIARHIAFSRRVELDGFQGTEVIIKSGLKPQDQVVVAGQQNLFEGAPVSLVGGAE